MMEGAGWHASPVAQTARRALNSLHLRWGNRAMRTLTLCLLAFFSLTACSNEPEYSDQERVCIAKQYKTYDRTKIDQCVKVCQSCFDGTPVSCPTSCKLKGAS
jgi:hypothetical protein